MKILFFIASLFFSVNGLANCQFDQQKSRVALVIGNSDYEHITPLRNPVNDAHSIAQVLRGYGFTVIERLNQTRDQMQQAITCFGNTLSEGGTGLVYYAGHGVQVGQENFLIPKDFILDENADDADKYIRDNAVGTNNIMGIFELINTRTNIVILDACRDNPFIGNSRSLRASRLQRELAIIAKHGLADMAAPAGSFIAFATKPGDTSSDGQGENGLFTEKLLLHLKNPNLDINSVFELTAADVYKFSNKDQIPWRRSSLLSKFYFSPNSRAIQSFASKSLNAPVAPSFDKYFNKGKTYLYDKIRPEKAINYFKKALIYSEDNAEVYYHLGFAYLRLTDYAEAITQLKIALRLNPKQNNVFQLLAKSYAGIGDNVTADKYRHMAMMGN